MRTLRFSHLLIALTLACSGAHERDDAGPSMDAAARADGAVSDAGPSLDAAGRRDAGEPVDAGPITCGGGTCPSGFICCERTGACYDPSDPTMCIDAVLDGGGLGVDAGLPGLDGAILPSDCIDGCAAPMTCCFRRGICCAPSDIICCPRP